MKVQLLSPINHWRKPSYKTWKALQLLNLSLSVKLARENQLLDKLSLMLQYPLRPENTYLELEHALAPKHREKHLGLRIEALQSYRDSARNAEWSMKLFFHDLSHIERENLKLWLRTALRTIQEKEDAEWVEKTRTSLEEERSRPTKTQIKQTESLEDLLEGLI